MLPPNLGKNLQSTQSHAKAMGLFLIEYVYIDANLYIFQFFLIDIYKEKTQESPYIFIIDDNHV
jgi:hypothetical protein